MAVRNNLATFCTQVAANPEYFMNLNMLKLGNHGYTLLHYAVEMESQPLIQCCLAHQQYYIGSEKLINTIHYHHLHYFPKKHYIATNMDGTPLHFAVAHGSTDILRTLITDSNVDLGVKDWYGFTVYERALHLDSVACLEILQPLPSSALHVAAAWGACRAIAYLLPQYSSAVVNAAGFNPLHTAILNMQPSSVTLLLQPQALEAWTMRTEVDGSPCVMQNTALGLCYHKLQYSEVMGVRRSLQACLEIIVEHLQLKVNVYDSTWWWWQPTLHLYESTLNHRLIMGTLMAASRFPTCFPTEIWLCIFRYLKFAVF